MIELNIIDKLGNYTNYNLYYFSIFQHLSFSKVVYDVLIIAVPTVATVR